MLLSAGVSFPCLTLKYRAFTVESHSVGETPTSYHYPTALFGVILLKLTPATSRGKYATSPRGCGLSCSSSKYRRFTFFNSYPTALFGEQRFNLFHNSSCTQSTPRVRGGVVFLALHPNIAVLTFSIIGQGEPHKTLYLPYAYSEGCAVTQPHGVRHGAKCDCSKAECV